MSASHVEFTPAASVDFVAPLIAMKVELPPPDPDNLALVMKNHGPALVALRAGGTQPPMPHAPGSVTLHGGQTLLLTDSSWALSDAATALVMPGGVTTGDGQQVTGHATVVTVTRGKLTERWLFGAPVSETI